MRNENLINTLSENIATLFGFIGSIKNEKIIWEKEAGEISIYDHIYHLSNCQENFYQRYGPFLTDDNADIFSVPLTGVSKVEKPEMSQVSIMMRTFEKWRLYQVELIKSTNGELWDKECIYSEFKKYSFESCIKDILLNDHFHVGQINQILRWEKLINQKK